MYATSVTTAIAMLLALTHSASAGKARVINNCAKDVYFASVASGTSSPMLKIPEGGYTQAYTGSENGTSINLYLSPNSTAPTSQFEFSLYGHKIAYDMSNIDGNPFAIGGMSLVPSMGADVNNPTCLSINCLAGQKTCEEAYNHPDDVRTLVCDSDSDLTLTLCPTMHVKRQNHRHVYRKHSRIEQVYW